MIYKKIFFNRLVCQSQPRASHRGMINENLKAKKEVYIIGTRRL